MKKIIVTLLVCIMAAVLFSGCENSSEASPTGTPTPTPDIRTTVTPTPKEKEISIKETADFWRYAIDEDHVIIYGYVGENIKEASIPSTIEGLPVTELSETALCYKMKIKISDSQYYCDLEKVTIPASVKKVSIGLFAQCKYLKEVDFAEGTDFSILNGILYNKDQSILYYCMNKDVQSFTIPSTVKIVAAGAFRECKNLSSATIPGNVNYVYDYAFYGCDELQSVKVQEGVKSIGNQVFSTCFKLKQLHLPKTLLAIGEKSVSYTNDLQIIIYKDSPIHEFFESEKMTSPTGSAAKYIDFVVFTE